MIVHETVKPITEAIDTADLFPGLTLTIGEIFALPELE